MLIGSSASLPQALRKTDDEQLSFSYTGSVYPIQKETLRLIPFFRLHDSRYAIYFHQVSEAEVESIRQEMEQKERKAMELANQTADIIFPGEQQPESDHGIRYEQAETGTNKDRHFRRAKADVLRNKRLFVGRRQPSFGIELLDELDDFDVALGRFQPRPLTGQRTDWR